MKIQLRGDRLQVTPALQEYVEKKIGRLEKYFDSPPNQKVQVTLSVLKEVHTVEVTMPVGGMVIRAEERSHDMYASIDLVTDKLEKQIDKHKTKINRRFREQVPQASLFQDHGALAVAPFVDDDEDEEEDRIVRVKRFAMKPMPVEEAVLQMDLLGHDFFVFSNAETEEVNVVYKRKDGNYGLIEPEF